MNHKWQIPALCLMLSLTSATVWAQPGGRGRAGAQYTPGWSMMNEQERREHHERLREMKTRQECLSYMEQHRTQMAERAKERGGKALGQPRRDPCAGLK